MANKWDLKTELHQFTSGATAITNLGSNNIPSGKNRFITYIRVDRENRTPLVGANDVTGLEVLLYSYTTGATNASAFSNMTYADLALRLTINKLNTGSSGMMIPKECLQRTLSDRPDIAHPLLTIAGGSAALLAIGASGPGANVFVQYYDE